MIKPFRTSAIMERTQLTVIMRIKMNSLWLSTLCCSEKNMYAQMIMQSNGA